METIVKIYHDGGNFSVSTNASNELEFLGHLVPELSKALMGVSAEHMTNHEEFLGRWLPQIVEICCKLRGYKADVHEERVIVAGYHMPAEIIRAFARPA